MWDVRKITATSGRVLVYCGISMEDGGKFNPLIIVTVAAVIGVGVAVFAFKQNIRDAGEEIAQTGLVEGAQITTEETAETEVIPASNSTEVRIVNIEGGAFYFKPNEIRAKAGEKINIVFANAGGIHDFVIDELSVQSTKIKDGETTEVEFTPQIPGTFEFYCSIGNHRAMGMKGTLVVE